MILLSLREAQGNRSHIASPKPSAGNTGLSLGVTSCIYFSKDKRKKQRVKRLSPASTTWLQKRRSVCRVRDKTKLFETSINTKPPSQASGKTHQGEKCPGEVAGTKLHGTGWSQEIRGHWSALYSGSPRAPPPVPEAAQDPCREERREVLAAAVFRRAHSWAS